MKLQLQFLSIAIALLSGAAASCGGPEQSQPVHPEKNAVYYWKTTFNTDSADCNLLLRHKIGRVYMRMFDVVADIYPYDNKVENRVVPNASIRICDPPNRLAEDLAKIEFVPVVYITLEALKAMKGHEGTLASNIVTRVRNMCEYNGLRNVSELQLDCDWTPSTENSFFSLCDSTRRILRTSEYGWSLSSTIRLHQLARKVPPVDRGVLMVYNTGSFDNPDAANSIIDIDDVRPYLKRLSSYDLHIDVAYPTYSWQLLFRDRRCVGLMDDANLEDTSAFARRRDNGYVALRDIPYHNIIIRAGDMVRIETSAFADIARVKDMIEQRLSERPHSNILYHLDFENLSKYTPNEINKILSTGR